MTTNTTTNITTSTQPTDSTSTGPDLTVTLDGESVTVEGTERGDQVGNATLKAHGFRWSRTLGAWFLPRPWRADTKRRRVNQFTAAMRQQGRTVQVIDTGAALDADAIHAGRRDRAADRAQYHREHAASAQQCADAHAAERRRISDSIPLGQPILLGHHSQARHERDIERIRTADRKDREQTQRVAHHQAAAQRAERDACTSENPVTTKRRIERLETERRQVARTLTQYAARAALPEGIDAAAQQHRAGMQARAEELDEQIRHHRARLDDAVQQGRTVHWSREHFQPGDEARTRWGWARIVRVNRSSLSVATGYSWTDTLPYIEVLGRRRNGVATTDPQTPQGREPSQAPAEPTSTPTEPAPTEPAP